MPVYDLSSGFNLLNQGIDSLGASLQNNWKQGQLQQLAAKLQAGDYDDASRIAVGMGDLQTGLSLKQQGQKSANDAQFGAQFGAATGQDSASPRPPLGAAPQSPASGASAPTMSGISPIAPQAARYFMQNGVTTNPLGAAALAAGFQAESRYDPGAIAKGDGRDGSDAINIGQWNGSRAVDFRNFATANRLDPNDPATGLAFSRYELQNKPEYVGIAQALNAARTPEEAQAAAIGYFAPKGYRPSNPQGAEDYARRLAYTRAIFGSLQAGTPQGQPASSQASAAPSPSAGASAAVEPPDPPVQIGNRAWTRAQAAADDSPNSPEVADVAKAQGIPWIAGSDDDDPGHADPSWGSGAMPGAVAGKDATALAASQTLPPHPAAAVAATAPGSSRRMNLLVNLLRLAPTTSNPDGNSKAVQALIEIERQNLTPTTAQKDYEYYQRQEIGAGRTPLSFSAWNDSSKEPTTYRSLTDPAARTAAGIPPNDTGIYQLDSHGRLFAVTPGRGNAARAGSVAAPFSRGDPPGPAAVAAPPGSGAPIAGARSGLPRLSPKDAAGLPRGSHFTGMDGVDRTVR